MFGVRWMWGGLAVAVLTILVPVGAAAQDPVTSDPGPAVPGDVAGAYRIPEDVSEDVRIDGRLTESFWSLVSPAYGFRQQDPEESEPATERTEVRIAYDADALYIGVMAFDRNPDGIVARVMQRDKIFEANAFGQPGIEPAGDDAVAILLDPFHDHRNGVIFATNPNGAEFEALVTDEGSNINIDWRGVWEVSSTRTADGWSAEFAIPWRTLRYPDATAGEPWGINVMRVIRRRNEITLWQAWEREGGGLTRVSRAGHLQGLVDLPRPGLNVEAKPYGLAARRQDVDDFGVTQSSNELSAGLDLKTEVRPGLLLDLTMNTDFAQVEVDDAQVNLTRFNLFFPEKRDFFLENSGIFEFGIPSNPLEPPAYQMFFSRQIGISEDGEVPILGGARLTGRVGSQTVGFMTVATDELPATGEAGPVERELFSVARVKRDVGESNYIGGMVVDRRGAGATNTTAGLDAQVLIGEAWIWDGFVSRSFTQGPGGDDLSYRVGYNYSGDKWGSFFDHYGIGPESEAAAGFITRTDYRNSELYGGHTWRPSALGLRDVRVFLGGSYASTVSDNRLQDWKTGFWLAPTWNSSDNVSIFVNAAETVVDEGFDLSDDVTVPAGRYGNNHIGWFGGTSRARMVSASTNGMLSQFYDGTLVSAGLTLTAALSAQFALEPGFRRNVVDVPNGDFTADITSLRVSYSFSTRMSVNALVQYNSLAEDFSTNVRFNFIHHPGSDLFIVFTENRGDELGVWNLSDRGLVMKVTYLMRL